MARRQTAPQKSRSASVWSWIRYGIRLAIAGAILTVMMFWAHQAEQYLIRSPRFVFEAPDIGLASPSLHVQGLHYASRAQVLRVFADDFGRSVYLVPLEQRRSSLRSLDWIQEASISRVWPNRVYVEVHERHPVAYLQMAGDRFARVALVDGEGVILQKPARATFSLPVITGIHPGDSPALRREKVHRLLALMNDLGSLGERVSEVDVTDRNNLRITAKAGVRGIVLLMGDQNFAARLRNFINHYAEIQRRLPGATALDLRLEDRITVVEDRQ